MNPLVTCLAQKGSRYLDNAIIEIRLSKTVIFVKMCSQTDIFENRQ